eukprot:m.82372 g.82372  ORF g.82372 m.82372 type:complete len:87 (+) comp8121_c0_seq1:246-506(+)
MMCCLFDRDKFLGQVFTDFKSTHFVCAMSAVNNERAFLLQLTQLLDKFDVVMDRLEKAADRNDALERRIVRRHDLNNRDFRKLKLS